MIRNSMKYKYILKEIGSHLKKRVYQEIVLKSLKQFAIIGKNVDQETQKNLKMQNSTLQQDIYLFESPFEYI